MNKTRRTRSSQILFPEVGAYRCFPLLESVLVLFLSAYAMTYKLIPRPLSDYTLRLGFVAAAVLFLYYFRREGWGEPLERSLLLLNVFWVYTTCVIHDSLKLQLSLACFWAILFYCVFAFGSSRSCAGREWALDVSCILLCAVLLIAAAAAIAITFTGVSPLRGWGVLERLAVLDMEGIEGSDVPMVYIKLFNTHRNTSSAFFVLGLGLMLSRGFRHQVLPWRLAAAVCAAAFYLAIALQHSRNTYGAASVCLAMCLGVALQEALKSRGALLRHGLVAVAVIVSAVLLFLSFNQCGKTLAAVTQVPTQVEENAQSQLKPLSVGAQTQRGELTLLSAAEESAQEPAQAGDERDTLDDMRTLTGRTDIWKAVLDTIRQHPAIALAGYDQWTMIDLVERTGGLDDMPHTHNTFLQQLLMTGVPGLLLYLGLVGILLVRMLRCYFSAVAASLRCLVATLAGMMLYGLLEPLLSCQVKFPSLLFCLVAGFFVQEWREWQDEEARAVRHRAPRRARQAGAEQEEKKP